MKSLPRYLFIALYAAFGVLMMLELADLMGFYTNQTIRLLIICGWIGVCFSAYLWMPTLSFASLRVRKTLIEEEEWLHPLCHELNLRSGITPTPEILILEDPRLNAFAIGKNKIVLSRGILVNLSEHEIKAVLAHEYGHLIHGDTRAASALRLAVAVPLKLYFLLNSLFKRETQKSDIIKNRRSLFNWVIIFIGIFMIGYHFPDLILIFTLFYIFSKVFPIFHALIIAIWCYFSQRDEYRQDRFAHSLGCGKHLKTALLKVDALDSGTLVPGWMRLWASHPMLYARIRRLEWMEGLRPTP